jgi:hypothetical protein
MKEQVSMNILPCHRPNCQKVEGARQTLEAANKILIKNLKECVKRNVQLEEQTQELRQRVEQLEKQLASAGQESRALQEGDADSSTSGSEQDEFSSKGSAAQAQQRAQKGAAGRQTNGSTPSKAAPSKQRTEGDASATASKRKRDNSQGSKASKAAAASSSSKQKKGSSAKSSKAPAASSTTLASSLVTTGQKADYAWAQDEAASDTEQAAEAEAEVAADSDISNLIDDGDLDEGELFGDESGEQGSGSGNDDVGGSEAEIEFDDITTPSLSAHKRAGSSSKQGKRGVSAVKKQKEAKPTPAAPRPPTSMTRDEQVKFEAAKAEAKRQKAKEKAALKTADAADDDDNDADDAAAAEPETELSKLQKLPCNDILLCTLAHAVQSKRLSMQEVVKVLCIDGDTSDTDDGLLQLKHPVELVSSIKARVRRLATAKMNPQLTAVRIELITQPLQWLAQVIRTLSTSTVKGYAFADRVTDALRSELTTLLGSDALAIWTKPTTSSVSTMTAAAQAALAREQIETAHRCDQSAFKSAAARHHIDTTPETFFTQQEARYSDTTSAATDGTTSNAASGSSSGEQTAGASSTEPTGAAAAGSSGGSIDAMDVVSVTQTQLAGGSSSSGTVQAQDAAVSDAYQWWPTAGADSHHAWMLCKLLAMLYR